MILAAAACAAAGISYILNDDEPATQTKYETVTVSSTIVDKQGIMKYIIYPRVLNPYVWINQERQSIVSKLPIENSKQINNSICKQQLSVIFFWSIPLKARLFQTSTNPCLVIENLNPFKRNLMKISIGIQNENSGIGQIPSEIILSNYDKYSYQTDDRLDSLSYNPMTNDHIIPIGILKKKKTDLNERENQQQKRFCLDKLLGELDSNEENRMRNMILKNVNLCVENLSNILSESCSNDEEQLTTLRDLSSIMNNNNNNHKLTEEIYENIHSKLYNKV
jgi:hypothetical protein